MYLEMSSVALTCKDFSHSKFQLLKVHELKQGEKYETLCLCKRNKVIELVVEAHFTILVCIFWQNN
jgi:hypothetical protein